MQAIKDLKASLPLPEKVVSNCIESEITYNDSSYIVEFIKYEVDILNTVWMFDLIYKNEPNN